MASTLFKVSSHEASTRFNFKFFSSKMVTQFSIIAQVIIEMRALSLVEDCVISRYNHPAGGDYNTEALNFPKWPSRDSLMFLKKKEIK